MPSDPVRGRTVDPALTTTAFAFEVRYGATEIMSGVTEVLCYGTAVVVAPGH